MSRIETVFLFDLDGTLIDSVYQHVIAWRDALEGVGINLRVWTIHRRIGMSGGLFVTALARALGTQLDAEVIRALPGLAAEPFVRRFRILRRSPGLGRSAGPAQPPGRGRGAPPAVSLRGACRRLAPAEPEPATSCLASQTAVRPPSTASTAPLTYAASSEPR